MTDRRLIEHGLPLSEVNAQSGREKSLRHNHISTLHLWWARRPLAMSRAVVAGTLLPDPGDTYERQQMFNDITAAASFEQSNGVGVRRLRRSIERAWPERRPEVLDCFAGGGAVPLEALRLGAEVTASDLNPVAYLIERCTLEYPQLYGQPDEQGRNPLAEDFLEWAEWVRDRVATDVEKIFPSGPDGRRAAVHFWTRTMPCHNPACGVEVPLLRDRWLANSTRRTVWVELVATNGNVDIRVRQGELPVDVDPSDGTVKASAVTCPRCSGVVAAKNVRSYARRHGFGKRLYAVLEIEGRDRVYRQPTEEEIEAGENLPDGLLETLDETPDGTSPVPDELMVPSQFRILRNLVYGIDTWAGLFNNRQLYVLATMCAAVRAAHEEMLATGMRPDWARALATYLALCVDRIVDYNSSFTTWRPTVEAPRGTYPQQAIRMAWHYTEINPVAEGPSNWQGAIRWIELAIRHCSLSSETPAEVVRADAQKLPWPNDHFDAVIVDPPYYDAFQYGDLSDLFYVWLK